MLNGVLNRSATFDDVFHTFVSCHETQLKSLGVSENKWKTLCLKLNNSVRMVFDAGDAFIYSQDQEIGNGISVYMALSTKYYQKMTRKQNPALEDDSSENEGEDETSNQSQLKVYSKCSMEPDDEDHIYLIDHAWTYSLENAKKVLEENRSLVERMCLIMNVPFCDNAVSDAIDGILKEMWKYNNSYVLQDQEQVSSASSFTRCWFIMDELGSLIQYSEEPTFAVAPFFFTGDRTVYSLLFPITNVSEFEEVTCGYPKLQNTSSEEMQKALKFPWKPCDLTNIDFNPTEPEMDYLMSGRHIEVLPDDGLELPSLIEEQKIRVYSDYPEVSEHLTIPRFYFTDNKNEAHILWLNERFYDYKQLADSQGKLFYISQFPSDHVLINKELLAIVCRTSCENSTIDSNTLEFGPKWLPTTYSLMMELPQFISFFQTREKRHLDNTWICKPFNLARGIDIYVTDNLTQIIRLNEIRPMVVCKYISDPVLFPKENVGLVKMDLRFIVLLRNVQELELFVYERFWIRFANKPFSMDDFEDYQKHFTVMNYNDFPLQQMFCHDFINEFEDFYSYKWSDVQDSIYKMIKEVFQASTMKQPPAGVGHYPGSRAMYGLDIMLEWDRHHEVPRMNPVILEVNGMPDCKRACQYYPEYYDDVFSVLFLNDTKERHVVQL